MTDASPTPVGDAAVSATPASASPMRPLPPVTFGTNAATGRSAWTGERSVELSVEIVSALTQHFPDLVIDHLTPPVMRDLPAEFASLRTGGQVHYTNGPAPAQVQAVLVQVDAARCARLALPSRPWQAVRSVDAELVVAVLAAHAGHLGAAERTWLGSLAEVEQVSAEQLDQVDLRAVSERALDHGRMLLRALRASEQLSAQDGSAIDVPFTVERTLLWWSREGAHLSAMLISDPAAS